MSLTVDILINSPLWNDVSGLEALTQRVIEQACKGCGIALAPGCEVSVAFDDDAQMQALNAKWRGMDRPTNVLSFPTPGETREKPLLGDIIVAYETVAREAREANKHLPDHIAHMIMHGFLHLVGYDHESVAEAEAMEAMERRIAATLGLDDPYALVPSREREGQACAGTEDHAAHD